MRVELEPIAFQTARSLAARVPIDRAHVLDAVMHARAQLLPAITAAAFAVDGMLGPVAAHLIFEHSTKAGRNANVFGIEKQDGHAAIGRVIGLASLGPDTNVPTSTHALIVDTRDDPTVTGADAGRIANGRAAMDKCGLWLPESFAGHVDQALEIHNLAREVVLRASRLGSRACVDLRINPADLLEVGFSPWVLLGRVTVGPPTDRARATAGRSVAPGLDPAVLRVVADRGMRPLAIAADSLTPLDPLLCGVVYERPEESLVGQPLVDALLTGDRSRVSALRELDAADIRAALKAAARDQIPFSPTAKYFVASEGLRLTGDGTPVKVSVLVRVDSSRAIAWTTTLDLADGEALSDAVARAELHVRTMQTSTLDGDQQFCKEHRLQEFQASTYAPHVAMRVVLMLANLAAVGVARRRDVGRGRT